jgi:type IV pilus assembly protein PilC
MTQHDLQRWQKTYIWKGVDHQGKYHSGQMEARNKIACHKELLKNNIFPLAIKTIFKLSNFCSQQIPTKLINEFYCKLSSLINANITLVNAIEIIAREEKNLSLQQLLLTIRSEIKRGNTLSSILKKYPQYFSQLTCNLIYAGEQSGTLDLMLKYIANYVEKTQQQKRKINKALFYPVAVLIVATIVTAILLVYVIPEFKNIFANFGAVLPLYTRMLFALALFIKKFGIAIIGGLFILAILFYWLKNHHVKFQRKFDALILQIPIFGILIKNGITFRIFKTLAITYQAGIPLIEALRTSCALADNWHFQTILESVVQAVIGGKPLHLAIKKHRLFNSEIAALIAIGEETGHLDEMLNKIANIYEEKIDRATENLNNLLEPLIMVILGIVVGGLIIGMYLPIFRIGKLM